MSNEVCIIYFKIFLLMFTFGGSSGIILGNIVLDVCLHDSYYVVSHFHVVLSLGSVVTILKSVLYYRNCLCLSLCVSCLSVCLILYQVIILLLGVMFIFVPVHYLSFHPVARRILDFVDCVNCWNLVSSIGCLVSVV